MSTQRIVFNAATTYARTIIAISLSLFSSRWVLNSLGVTDYGLYSLVSSVIVFVSFFNGVLTGSVSRHLAYSIGQGEFKEINSWFNSALFMHLVIATVLVIVGWCFGEYIVFSFLSIPFERIEASLLVYRMTLISAFFSMVSVPFMAMFAAKQHIAEVSIWGIFQSLLYCLLSWSLRYVTVDRFCFYAAGVVVIVVFCQAIQMVRAVCVFDDCRINWRLWFNLLKLKKVLSFAGWNLFGYFGMLSRDQGSAILLNLYFGPNVNAAYGIATQISAQANQLSNAMIGAVSPEIIAREGRGERAQMLTLALDACKFGSLLVILIFIPLILEMKYVLKLWLHDPPLYADVFCKIILITFLIDRLSVGYMMAVNAHGKIERYQATIGMILFITLPLVFIIFNFGYGPSLICIAFVTTILMASFGRVLWGKQLFSIPVSTWLASVVWPCFIVFAFVAILAFIPHCMLKESFYRLVCVSIVSFVSFFIFTWLFILKLHERRFIKSKIIKYINI